MPYVRPVSDGLVELAATAKNLDFQMKSLKTAVSQAAGDRRVMVLTGDRLRSRLASALAFEKGSTSVQLREFGLRPRAAGRHKTKPVVPVAPIPAPPR